MSMFNTSPAPDFLDSEDSELSTEPCLSGTLSFGVAKTGASKLAGFVEDSGLPEVSGLVSFRPGLLGLNEEVSWFWKVSSLLKTSLRGEMVCLRACVFKQLRIKGSLCLLESPLEPLIRCCPGFSTEFIQVTELNEGEVVPKSKSGTACGAGSCGVNDKAGAGAGL